LLRRVQELVLAQMTGRAAYRRATEIESGKPTDDLELDRLLSHPYWEVRNKIVKFLGKQPTPERVQRLREKLGDRMETGIVRRNAAEALAAIPSPEPETIEVLLRALSDPYWEVRSEAARALWSVASPDEAVEARLIEALEKESDFEVVCSLAQALGGLGVSGRSFEALARLIMHTNWIVRSQAAVALSEFSLRHPEREGALKEALGRMDFRSDGVTAKVVLTAKIDGLADAIEQGDAAAVRRLYFHLKNGWRGR